MNTRREASGETQRAGLLLVLFGVIISSFSSLCLSFLDCKMEISVHWGTVCWWRTLWVTTDLAELVALWAMAAAPTLSAPARPSSLGWLGEQVVERLLRSESVCSSKVSLCYPFSRILPGFPLPTDCETPVTLLSQTLVFCPVRISEVCLLLTPLFFSLVPRPVSPGKAGRAQRGVCHGRHAVPIWEVPQVSSRHCEEPEGEHGRSGKARHLWQKGRKGMYWALFYIFNLLMRSKYKTNYGVIFKN